MYDKSITFDNGYWVSERKYDHVTTHGPMSFEEARIKYDSLPPDDGGPVGGLFVYDRCDDHIDSVEDQVRAALKEATQC